MGTAGERPDRDDAAAERLRGRQEVGDDAPVLAAEHPARAAQTGLHFIEDQQRPSTVADLTYAAEVAVRRDDHPGLALDRLEDNGGGFPPPPRPPCPQPPAPDV